jgi:MoxR-like ATPase
MSAADKIKCALCSHEDFYLGEHVLSHGLTLAEYQTQHPDAPTIASVVWDAYKGKRIQRVKPPAMSELKVKFGGTVQFNVNVDVPEDECLPMPPHYKCPEHGKLKRDIGHAAVSLARGRSMYIWGLPGTGKDAFFHAYSAMTRTPGAIFQVKPGVDITSWFYTRSFDKDGTAWIEGQFLKAARDGYLTEDGRRVPYILLITDFDRADRSQGEALRLVLDSISGRIIGPEGETYKVMPGTIIATTANTSGGGDVRGRMISSNVLDASLMDRFQVKLEFHNLDWKDESVICKAKFPVLAAKCPAVFDQIGGATTKLREAIEGEELHWEFSHRAVCNWLTHAEDIIHVLGGKVPPNILKRAARVVLDGAPDEETREGAKKIMDPHINGGTLDSGGYSEKGNLADGFS